VPLAKLRVAARRALGAHSRGNSRRRKGKRKAKRKLGYSASMLGL
jgi:hypothetical protein